jgi:hypothetical protein
MKISDLWSPHTLAAAVCLRRFGIEALANPVVMREVARFVSQPQTVSYRHLKSLPINRAIPENMIQIVIDEMALVCSNIL